MYAVQNKFLDAYFAGESLRGSDPNIQVMDIGWENIGGISWRQKTRLMIVFCVSGILAVTTRKMAVEAANAWARNGYIEVSSKPDQRLFVVCCQHAEVNEETNPNEMFSLVFETIECPYWEDVRPTLLGFSAKISRESILAPGTMGAVADVSVVPRVGRLNELSIKFGYVCMSFSGLGVDAGESLVIGHDENMNLCIKAGEVSKWACCNGASDDGFSACSGETVVDFRANTLCDVVFSLRGRSG